MEGRGRRAEEQIEEENQTIVWALWGKNAKGGGFVLGNQGGIRD